VAHRLRQEDGVEHMLNGVASDEVGKGDNGCGAASWGHGKGVHMDLRRISYSRQKAPRIHLHRDGGWGCHHYL
jgi:hypothetical protein